MGTLLQSGDFSDAGWTDGDTEEFVVGHNHGHLDHLTAYGWVGLSAKLTLICTFDFAFVFSFGLNLVLI